MAVRLTIDDREIEVQEGTTIWEAARQLGIQIPTLCHDPGLEPVGVCRICSVEVEGARVLAASCVRVAEEGMVVRSSSPGVERARELLLSLLAADQPAETEQRSNSDPHELSRLEDACGALEILPGAATRARDDSSAAIFVDHQACILCDRCIRACGDLQNHDIIRRSGKGYDAQISFDLNAPMGDSNCVSCGECVAACPTDALRAKTLDARLPLGHQPEGLAADAAHSAAPEIATVDSVCPYCGVGCALTYHVDQARNRITLSEGRPGSGNEGRLCVKGRYGYDYAMHAQRLTVPLIRRDYPKGPLSSEVRSSKRNRRKSGAVVRYEEVMPSFREASWEEALSLIAERFTGIRDEHGPDALAGFGSAKCSNEEAYLFQKLVRTAFGTNNVDHCTRLCHASSVAALLETIGSGAVTTTYRDIANSDFALITGSNATANHPVAATFFTNAARQGTKLLVVDPRYSKLVDHAWRFCQIRPGTDVAFYNGMMKVILDEGLIDQDFIDQRTENFDAIVETVARYPLEVSAGICGVPADLIREVAIEYGKAAAAITFWGMGMSQHVHGTDNCRCLISLCLMTGNLGRPGTGLHPLRGQNNVQGASDAGLIPMFFPGYRSVSDPEARAEFESAWGTSLSPKPGLTVTEIVAAAVDERIKGMYILGENPFISDPNTHKVKKGLMQLDFLAVQDIFLTETAEFADVVLPASSALEKLGTFTNTDRRVQIGRPALKPPGDARLDWEIICEIGTRMGTPMHYESPSQIFDEFTSLSQSYQGLDYDNLGPGGKLYPCPDPESSEGTVVMFGDAFPTRTGKARFVAAEHVGGKEVPDAQYPFILVTGRVLEHWHTGTMTRRSHALSSIEPEAFVQIHPDDCAKIGVHDGQYVSVISRRGSVTLALREDAGNQPGAVFIPFHYREASANVLTTDDLDPDGKIPEVKFCAVRVEPA